MQPDIKLALLAESSPFPINLRPAPRQHESRVEQLERCGLHFERHRVRILTAKENAYVRKGFTQVIKRQHWDLARRTLRLDVELNYDNLSEARRKEIYKERRAQLEEMDLHHAIQIMTCPIDLSPHADWKKTLKWWRRRAHRRIVPVEKKLHRLIHAVQDRKIAERFGAQALLMERESGVFQGEIDIVMLEGSRWQPVPKPIENSESSTGIILPFRSAVAVTKPPLVIKF